MHLRTIASHLASLIRAGALPVAVAPVLLCLASGVGEGAVIINMAEQAGDVVATTSGTINLSSLTFNGNTGQSGLMVPVAGILYLGGFTNNNNFDTYDSNYSPIPFGTGGFTSPDSFTDSFSGDVFGVGGQANNQIFVPPGYISGTSLSSTATWSNTTLATLGADPGTYVWSWDKGGIADSVTLNIAQPVPEPSTLTLLGLAGAGGLLAWRRRRRAT